MLTKLVLRVNQNQAALGSNFGAAFEEGEGVLFEQGILFGSGKAFSQDFFLRNVFVVFAILSLGGGGDNGRGELLIFLHTLGQLHTTNFAHTALVSTPCAATQVATYNHFNGKTLAHQAYSDHGVGGSHFPVGANIGSCIQKLSCNLVEHLTFVRNAFGQNDVESRDTVGCYHDQTVAQVVHVAYFSMIYAFLSGEVKFGMR